MTILNWEVPIPQGFFGFFVKACSTRVQDRHGGFVRDDFERAPPCQDRAAGRKRSRRSTHPVSAGGWLHDLRRTLATGLQRLGVRLEVTEAVLNHLSGSRAGVVGIYQRHDWAEEKRVALDAQFLNFTLPPDRGVSPRRRISLALLQPRPGDSTRAATRWCERIRGRC